MVHVARGLELMCLRRREKAVEGGGISALFHVPARRFRAEVDLCHDDYRRDSSATQHPTPGRSGAADDGEVPEGDADKEAEHDAECGPHLPHHGEGAANCFGCGFLSLN